MCDDDFVYYGLLGTAYNNYYGQVFFSTNNYRCTTSPHTYACERRSYVCVPSPPSYTVKNKYLSHTLCETRPSRRTRARDVRSH